MPSRAQRRSEVVEVVAVTVAQDDTRSRVLGVTVQLLAEKGYAETSTREVCERMGFTKAALWYHFRSKNELLAAVLHPVAEALTALVSQAPAAPGPAGRRALLAGYVDLVAQHRDLVRVLYDDPSARRTEAVVGLLAHYEQLVHVLVGPPTDPPLPAAPDGAGSVTARARARAALGATHAVLLRAPSGDDPAEVRRAALVSACGALGVPAPRSS